MKKLWLFLLALLLLLPLAAGAGDDSDPLRDYGIAPALQGTDWAEYQHMWNIYYEENHLALAVLYNDQQRVLAEFGCENGAWRLLDTYPQAVCQGTFCATFATDTGDAMAGGNLRLSHTLSPYNAFETFEFRRENGTWVFDHAYFATPLEGLAASGGDGTDPSHISYVTWENGQLVYTFYVEDLYQKLPGEKVAQPGNGHWFAAGKPREQIAWPAPITLATFDVHAFPRDSYSAVYESDPARPCAFPLGQPDRYAQAAYAVVRNPNPKDRLNLRVEAESGAQYLGKYYNGTKVRILDEETPDWVRVFVGNNRSGYMKREYLAFGAEMDAVENAMPVYTMKPEAWTFYHAPFAESSVKARYPGGERIEVMGIVSGWWHIRVGEETGFIPELESLE